MTTSVRAKGLVLPGYACTSQIWNLVRAELDAVCDLTWVDWPREQIGEFHTVEAFTQWLLVSIKSTRYDFVIGHSMGGLVALEAASQNEGLFRQIILVETFLTPPTPFFQNLFLETASEPTKRPVLDMLEHEKAFYSPRLREVLRQVDMGLLMRDLSARVQALYGDRGCGDPNRVIQELALPQEWQTRVKLSVVPNACHFPMVENAAMTAQLLKTMVE